VLREGVRYSWQIGGEVPNSDQYEMGWNDLLGNLKLRMKQNKRVKGMTGGARHYFHVYSKKKDTFEDYRKGVLDVCRAILEGKSPRFKGPKWVVDEMKKRVM
jgi:hypothetical protein